MREFKNCTHVVKSCDMGKHILDCPCRFLHETGTEHLDESLKIRNSELDALNKKLIVENIELQKKYESLGKAISAKEDHKKPGRPKR